MQSPVVVPDNVYHADKESPGSLPVTLEQKEALCWEALLEDTGPRWGASVSP